MPGWALDVVGTLCFSELWSSPEFQAASGHHRMLQMVLRLRAKRELAILPTPEPELRGLVSRTPSVQKGLHGPYEVRLGRPLSLQCALSP